MHCHCEERSDEAISTWVKRTAMRLLRGACLELDSLPSADSSVALLPQNDKGEKPQKSRKRKARNDDFKCYWVLVVAATVCSVILIRVRKFDARTMLSTMIMGLMIFVVVT